MWMNTDEKKSVSYGILFLRQQSGAVGVQNELQVKERKT